MKTKLTALTLALLACAGSVTLADPLGTAFTYQGRLNSTGQPANGHYDLRFTLYDAVTEGNVPVLTIGTFSPPSAALAGQRPTQVSAEIPVSLS